MSASEKRMRRMVITRAIVVGAWFLFTSVYTYFTFLSLGDVAISGQAEGELFAKLRECGRPHTPWKQESLNRCVADFFREHEDQGVRYASSAVPMPGGERLFAEAGSRLSPPALDQDLSMRGRPLPFEDRYVYIMPPHHHGPRRPKQAPRAPQRLASHVLEFEPTQAQALWRGGLVALIAGILGVGVMLRGSLRMLGLVRDREEAQRQAREQEKLAILGQMSAVMAHELRNPLASAKGHSQLLAEMAAPGTKLQKKADLVVQELLRVERLTDDLLAFVRSGKVNRSDCDPAALAREVAARAVISTPVELDTEAAPPNWSLDPHAIERVLVNLLKNAAQAQEGEQTPIQLRVCQEGKDLYMAVRDHGPGLAEGVDVFIPFTSTKTTGTGLGLAVSRQSVEAHGGRLSLKNHPEGGAIAEIFIPPKTVQPEKLRGS